MRRIKFMAAAAALALVMGVQADAMPTRSVVLRTDAYENNPAASETYLAWAVWGNDSHPVYAMKLSGGARVRVNRTGWDGGMGGIWGDELVYQEYSHKKGIADIFIFDLVSHDRRRVGAPVSTNYWEYRPSISEDFILFARLLPGGARKLILYDRNKDRAKVIDSVTGARAGLYPGQVNGDFAVWDRIMWDAEGHRWTSCNVFRYRISTGSLKRIDNPNQRCQYGASISADGTTFYGRSGFRCGMNALIRRLPFGGSPSTIQELPSGRDFGSTYAVDRIDGKVDVFYDQALCTGADSDIHKLTVP